MSWQLATFGGLALALVGGFWWYERSRPSARLMAVVAALAALAIAGRLVLAPLPNVVATTDVALITGYALGAGPGFAVGALAAPISNIWLGQGPWTVWEMAGWGLVGLGGAWLAIATRRRLGRLGLALACALAGFAYGALLDLSVMVTYGGEQSLDRYLALSVRGIPFNVAHAAGNFAIALAAGPALVRMISRFRTRLEFTWRPVGAVSIALVALALPAASLVSGRPAAARASATALEAAGRPGGEREAGAFKAAAASRWLASAQNTDGGFAATPGQPSSPAMTGWAILGLEAGGRNPLDLERDGETPITYLRSQRSRLRSVGDLERTILGLVGAGIDPSRFAATDLVARLRARRDDDGSVDGQVNLTAFYALAMRAAGADTGSLKRSATWLREAQNPDGGWGIQAQAPSEADSTGAALQGLVAADSRGPAAANAAAWLRQAQRSNGGYALGSTGIVNAQSTSWAVQGLAAAAAGSAAISSALEYLSRVQSVDGHYRYSGSSDQTPVWVTAQSLLAVERRPFPIAAVARAESASRGSSQEPDSGGSRSGAPGGPAGAPGAVTAGQGGDTGGGSGASLAGGESTPAPASGNGGGAVGTAGLGSEATPTSAGGGASSSASAASESQVAASGETVPVGVSVSYAPDQQSGDVTNWLLAGLGLFAVGVAGGYIFYRRRRL